MGIISQMAEKCQKCPKRDACDHKRMEACAYIDMPINCAPVMPQTEPLININIEGGISANTEDILREITNAINKALKINCAW